MTKMYTTKFLVILDEKLDYFCYRYGDVIKNILMKNVEQRLFFFIKYKNPYQFGQVSIASFGSYQTWTGSYRFRLLNC